MIIIGQILKERYSMTVQGISNERVPAFGYYNLDCMEGMKHFPDNYFDLAIVDPPYFSGPERRGHYGYSESPIGVNRLYEKMNKWQVPGEEYFIELLRVSKEQIIWGCNYYDYNFGPGRIVWDKCNGSSNFSDCEIAYCSMQTTVRLFRYMWNGMFQGRSMSEGWVQQGNKARNEKRLHSTQKPVILYEWLLQKYAKPGFKILDTHVGSASSLIACHKMSCMYVGYEIDKKMYQLSSQRLKEETAQMSIFEWETCFNERNNLSENNRENGRP